jgi:hypothetical protein
MLYLSFFKLNDLKWPPHSLWPSSAENHFKYLQIWKICGFSRFDFSQAGPQRPTESAARSLQEQLRSGL